MAPAAYAAITFGRNWCEIEVPSERMPPPPNSVAAYAMRTRGPYFSKKASASSGFASRRLSQAS
jgi:hypothetical protein